ncbi:Polyisoprenoid-binding protein YceI [Fodinibius sediminis]|uniref:Polyisoprenoid-binding protein YceI n=2 Tax=Fodinibius sediminis TaxID=1214077 RepID=A0A521B253_9BACT|nr:Polyisoprenoid-binding protein YceI [Fodinibius sediminis]
MSSKQKLRLVLLLGGFLLALSVEGIGQVYMTKNGHAEFKSSVPLHSFTGHSDKLVGKISLSDSTVDFYVDVHTLKTGIRKRDEDMLETLQADQYPFAEFFGKLASPFDSSSSDAQDVTVRGDFSMHGISRKLSVDGTLQKTDKGLKVDASWTINMENYNIEPPGILFYRVSEKIPISISATLASQPSK